MSWHKNDDISLNSLVTSAGHRLSSFLVVGGFCIGNLGQILGKSSTYFPPAFGAHLLLGLCYLPLHRLLKVPGLRSVIRQLKEKEWGHKIEISSRLSPKFTSSGYSREENVQRVPCHDLACHQKFPKPNPCHFRWRCRRTGSTAPLDGPAGLGEQTSSRMLADQFF